METPVHRGENDDPAADEPEYALGVLFVHGIGTQKRGETLAAFGVPLYRWLKDRFHGRSRGWLPGEYETRGEEVNYKTDTREVVRLEEEFEEAGWGAEDRGVELRDWESEIKRLVELDGNSLRGGPPDPLIGQVRLTDSLVSDPLDPDAPAQVDLGFRWLRRSGEVETEEWLLAESCWAETFPPPSFTEFGQWGLRVLSRTLGSHYAHRIRRSWRRLPGSSFELLGSCIGLVGTLILSPVLLAVLAFLVLFAVLPVPWMRGAILRLQLRIASTLGDSFVLLNRPLEAASIESRLRRDLDWLSQRCAAVAIVAHSQGGALVHEALLSGWPSRLGLVFTFGSGLKKLTELRDLQARGQGFVFSANVLPVAVTTLSASIWSLARALGSPEPSGELGTVAWAASIALLSMVFVAAGIRDLFGRFNTDDLVRRIRWLTSSGPDWRDCFATADPVSNGILLEIPEVEERSKEVGNEGSILRDHTSYWSNRDEFVSHLVDQLTGRALREPFGLPAFPDLSISPWEFKIGEARRWRTGILRLVGWLGGLAVILSVAREWQDWKSWLGWLGALVKSQTAALVGNEIARQEIPAVSGGAAVTLLLAIVFYGFSRARWRNWNEKEMFAVIAEARHELPDLWLILGIAAQLTLASSLAFEHALRTWLGYLYFFVTLIVLFGRHEALFPMSTGWSEAAPRTSVEGVLRRLWKNYAELTLTYVWWLVGGMITWAMLTSFAEQSFGGRILGFDPSTVPGLMAGVVSAAVGIVLRAHSLLRGRESPPRRPVGDLAFRLWWWFLGGWWMWQIVVIPLGKKLGGTIFGRDPETFPTLGTGGAGLLLGVVWELVRHLRRPASTDPSSA